MKEHEVVLSEDDYVAARKGNQREHYRPEIAHASRLTATKCIAQLGELALAQGLESMSMADLVRLSREVMLARYEAEVRRSAS